MLVPSSIQEKLEYKKLTCYEYVHLHLAVLPLKKHSERTLDDNLVVWSCVANKGQENLHGDNVEWFGCRRTARLRRWKGSVRLIIAMEWTC
jgi:hypothetical protein